MLCVRYMLSVKNNNIIFDTRKLPNFYRRPIGLSKTVYITFFAFDFLLVSSYRNRRKNVVGRRGKH